MTEAAEQNWSISTLDRNISTLYYQRLLSSQNEESVKIEKERDKNVFMEEGVKYGF